jgi:hypothetical protein
MAPRNAQAQACGDPMDRHAAGCVVVDHLREYRCAGGDYSRSRIKDGCQACNGFLGAGSTQMDGDRDGVPREDQWWPDG